MAYILGQIGPAAAPATRGPGETARRQERACGARSGVGAGQHRSRGQSRRAGLGQSAPAGDENANAHAVAYALGKIGPDAAEAEPALSSQLKSADSELALVSAWALAQIQPASAETATKTVPVLIAGLKNSLPKTRQAAAETLGGLGPLAQAAAADLREAMKDDDEGVRSAAAGALKSIAAPEAKTPEGAARPIGPGSIVVTLEADVPLHVGAAVHRPDPPGQPTSGAGGPWTVGRRQDRRRPAVAKGLGAEGKTRRAVAMNT